MAVEHLVVVEMAKFVGEAEFIVSESVEFSNSRGMDTTTMTAPAVEDGLQPAPQAACPSGPE